jgi:hypothetical protein
MRKEYDFSKMKGQKNRSSGPVSDPGARSLFETVLKFENENKSLTCQDILLIVSQKEVCPGSCQQIRKEGKS